MAVSSIEMEQTITLEIRKAKPSRKLSTKEVALRMLRDLANPQDAE